MTEFLLSNFGQAELTAAVDADATTLQIDAGLADRFPVPVGDQAFAAVLWDGAGTSEIVYCTTNGLDGSLTVLRGQEDSTARAWLAGTQFRQFLTRDTITNLLQTGFIAGNVATQAEAEAGVLDDKLMTPEGTTQHFESRSTSFSRGFLMAEDQVEGRRALGWAAAVFSGTGLETTFTLPDSGYDTPFTRVYVDEGYVISGYAIAGNQLIFDVPPDSGVDNIVVVLGENFAFSISFPGNNTVSEDALIDGAVTSAKLASGAVTTSKLANNSVTYSKFQQISDTDKVLGRSSGGAGNAEEIPFTAAARIFAALSSVAAQQTALTTTGWPVPTGMVGHFFRTAAPTGWIKANGGTIGSASSGASTRANADTEALFTELWATAAADLPIYTSAGTLSTRGASAAADFAANKRLTVPDLRGEFVRGLDDSRGIDAARALASAQGGGVQAHTHTGTTASGGAHNHTYGPVQGRFGANSESTSVFRGSTGDSNGSTTTMTVSDHTGHTHTFTTDSTGIGETRPRNVAALACLKL